MLAQTPRPIPRWVRYGETTVARAIPYLRGCPGMKPGGSVSLAERIISTLPALSRAQNQYIRAENQS